MENLKSPYFPPLYGNVDCRQCEESTTCICAGKHQRNRRDFTYTSGRCPRLPDRRGFVEKEYQNLYAAVFPLIYAERGEDVMHLSLSLPGKKRLYKVYRTKSGFWYFRHKNEYGWQARQMITIPGYDSEKDIFRTLDVTHSDYCILRCEIEDDFV